MRNPVMRPMPRIFLFTLISTVWLCQANASNKAAPIAMSVEDFVVDKDTIHGRVSVKGSVACIGGGLCYLYGDNISTTINFDASKLPREDRKKFLSCSPFTSPCIITITGRTSSGFMASLTADTVAWEPTEEDLAAADSTVPACDTVDNDDLKSMAESSALAQMIHLKVIDIKVITSLDKNGHKHCVAEMTTSAGDKKMNYFLQHNGDGSGYSINGKWIS
jgi:hypothetical protein